MLVEAGIRIAYHERYGFVHSESAFSRGHFRAILGWQL